MPYHQTSTRIITAVFLLLLAAGVPAQEPAAVQKALGDYQSQRLPEKIFVHTDKDIYLAGEICWFKLYVVDAQGHHPLDLSKVAYLEWLDAANKPVLQAKIGLGQAHGDGSVYLPMSLPTGNYKLRAYTNWMKNDGADWFFEKTISVVNSRRPPDSPTAKRPVSYKVEFFPEGGNLVENSTSRIAFSVKDQYGHGLSCSGIVTEDDQDTVVRIQTLQYGIGSFLLKPRPGHRYRSTLRLADGTALSDLLPSAYKEGVVMRVSQEKGSGQLRIELESGNAGSQLFLIAHTRQVVKVAESITLTDGKASLLIDKKSLGEGISHLTVFSADRQPVCERLVFRQPSHVLPISIKADKDSYITRSRISLGLSLPTTADCSLSVYKIDSLEPPATADQIGSYLWLSSDLKGKIESPSWYFEHPEEEQAMDNLMLSQGWRRFRWGDVLHPGRPLVEFPPEYKGAIISGRVVNIRTGAAGGNMPAYLSVPGTRTQFTAATSDDEGRIKFEMPDFYGGQELIVQTNPLLDSLYRVDLANPFVDSYSERRMTQLQLSPDLFTTLADRSVAVQVLNRYGGLKLKQFSLAPGIDTTPFYNSPDHSYLLDNYVRFTTLEEVMREYVTEMQVRRRDGHFHLPLFDIPNSKPFANALQHIKVFDDDPLILLDGVPIFDLDSLLKVDPLKIRLLETLQRRYFLGSAVFEGIMNLVTYKGDMGGYVLDPHAAVVDYEGLQLQREFYSPSYATEEERAGHIPDFRNLLFWSPVVPIDKKGKGELSFYSSDLPGRYMVVVEGLAPDGTPGSARTIFEVK